MSYIVYREKFNISLSGLSENGGGYFVRYENKSKDKYSPNWFDAHRYRSLGPALNRMGIRIDLYMDTMEKFTKANQLDYRSMQRDNIISDVLGIGKECLIFKMGRIDKISDSGDFLGSAEKEVTEYITAMIDRNKIVMDRKLKSMNKSIGQVKMKIIETKEGEDFWEGF